MRTPPIYSVPVDKDVPVARTAGRKSRYPWAAMAPGDSFLVPPGRAAVATVRVLVSRRHRDTAERYTTRVTDAGLRVWRRA